MGIGTFGAFTQARLAIYAAQTGITVTGNNISNINTPGYTRQRLDQVSLYAAGSDRYYAEGDVRVGQGALVKSISQIRNPYLDIRYREENAKVGFYDARLEGLNSIQRILDEVGKGDASKGEDGQGILGLNIMKLYETLKNVTDQTGHQEYDDSVKAVAASLATQLHAYANQLEQVRKDTIHDFKEDVDEVNALLTSIRAYNEEIRKCEIHGDPALELRDSRNNAIDQLSALIDIDVTYSEEEIAAGVRVEKLTIRLGDANPDKTQDPPTDRSLLIDGVYSAKIYLGKPMENPYYGAEDPSEEMDALEALLDEKEAAGEIADLAARAELKNAFLSSPYLKKDENGSIMPASDLRDATILTEDEDNPNYDFMITELRNKAGDLNYEYKGYSPVQVAAGDLPADLVWNAKTNMSQAITEEDVPEKGDKTITVYTRTPVRDADGKPIAGQYTYTKQTYEHIISKPVALDDNDLYGELQAERELLTEEGVFIDADTIANIDENAAIKRGIGYYQKVLDLLANQLATTLNEANQGFLMDDKGNYIEKGVNDKGEEIGVPIEITGADGNSYKINKDWGTMDAAAQNAVMDAVGITAQEMEDNGLTGKNITDAYLKGQTWTPNADGTGGTFTPENREDVLDKTGAVVTPGWGGAAGTPRGIFVGGPLFSNANNSNDTTGITASNINVSQMWSNSPILVRSFTCPPGHLEPASGQSDNLTHLEYLVGEQKIDFIPNQLDSSKNGSGKVLFSGTFHEMWNNIGGTIGEDQKEAGDMLDTYYQSALSIDTDRASVSSVDFNDEAMNLMMYAKSYNAACRLMTTIDSVLDKLINNTGMTT